jgi:Mrp family chromosome partitioning ATPase
VNAELEVDAIGPNAEHTAKKGRLTRRAKKQAEQQDAEVGGGAADHDEAKGHRTRHGKTRAELAVRAQQETERAAWNLSGTLGDGGLAIVDSNGGLQHVVPAAVASSIRYFIARLRSDPGAEVPRRLAFTSALSGEGVSFITGSFGAVLAHDLARRVCIVDLNWWGGDSSDRGEGSEGNQGISDVLLRGVDYSDVVLPTQLPGLWYVHSGDAPMSVRSNLVHSADLAILLNRLDEHFDHLIVDLPPVLVTSDSLDLAGLCDGYALVVRQGSPTRTQVQQALDDMRRVPMLGIVLNQVKTRVPRLARRLLGL